MFDSLAQETRSRAQHLIGQRCGLPASKLPRLGSLGSGENGGLPCQEYWTCSNVGYEILGSLDPTWWLIPLSKWVITGVITHLLSGMSHQVGSLDPNKRFFPVPRSLYPNESVRSATNDMNICFCESGCLLHDQP